MIDHGANSEVMAALFDGQAARSTKIVNCLRKLADSSVGLHKIDLVNLSTGRHARHDRIKLDLSCSYPFALAHDLIRKVCNFSQIMR
jgi:hypothetical protein